MIEFMIIFAIILIVCIVTSKALHKFGVPILLVFIVLGMLFGTDSIGKIAFSNYKMAQELCSLGLLFIMFYGGFCTNWKRAKPVAVKSILMSTVGVVITAGLTGVFCFYVIKTSFLEGLLIGSVVASTDAASVFAILRSQKLKLKGSLSSILEAESGSNDPFAYLCTIVILTLMSNGGFDTIIPIFLKQIVFGLVIGFLLAKGTVYFLRKANFDIDGFYAIFVTAIAILSFYLSEWVGGNGFLSVYISGIVLGNNRIPHKKSLIHFFDGISWIMQIMLFFMLGLLAFPSRLPDVLFTGVAISIFLIFVARPIATFSILSFFKVPIKEQVFIAWVGLRGAASIVFAIFAVNYDVAVTSDIFHIVFFVALFSVAVQGTLLPKVARSLDLVDNNSIEVKTFNDFKGEESTQLIEVPIDKDSKWSNKSIMDADIPEEILIVMIKRFGRIIVPKGSTLILPGDILVLSGNDLSSLIS